MKNYSDLYFLVPKRLKLTKKNSFFWHAQAERERGGIFQATLLLMATKLKPAALMRTVSLSLASRLHTPEQYFDDKRRAKFKRSQQRISHKHTLAHYIKYSHVPYASSVSPTINNKKFSNSVSHSAAATTTHYKGGVRNGKTLFGFPNSVTPITVYVTLDSEQRTQLAEWQSCRVRSFSVRETKNTHPRAQSACARPRKKCERRMRAAGGPSGGMGPSQFYPGIDYPRRRSHYDLRISGVPARSKAAPTVAAPMRRYSTSTVTLTNPAPLVLSPNRCTCVAPTEAPPPRSMHRARSASSLPHMVLMHYGSPRESQVYL